VKQLVDLHGGELRLESAVGKGTRVTFILPAERVRTADTSRQARAGE
jgi:signal transduction histidine kinase